MQAADRQRQYGQQLTGTGPRVSGEDEVVCWCFHHDTAGGLDSFMKACPCQHCCDHVCVFVCLHSEWRSAVFWSEQPLYMCGGCAVCCI